ncbi:ATP-dependent DNA helicase MER3 [Paecilomyces lecythidis]|uniref:ATP-dependent DNA helicase MER3 n=1 Tax=Paecilomyces lecythidis TaxID=3004212 RepID=A0ABR3XCE5_9EURO
MNKKQTSISENKGNPNLNQLTISASIKKDGSATHNTPKATKKVSRIDSIEIVDLSQSPSTKFSVERHPGGDKWQHSNAAASKAANTKYRPHNQSEILTSKHQTIPGIDLDHDIIHDNRRSSSSEYGDSGLDDLPSPSVLLPVKDGAKTVVKGPSKLTDQVVDATGQENGAISNFKDLLVDDGDDIWFISENAICDINNTQRETAKDAAVAGITELSGSFDALSPPTGSSLEQSLPSFLKTDSDPMLTQYPDTEVIRGQKRDISLMEGNEGGNDHRKKSRSEDLCGILAKESTDARESLTIPDGWEGIDQSLLEEFKDIVNFF